MYVLTFYVFNKRVHLLVERILMLCTFTNCGVCSRTWQWHELAEIRPSLFCDQWQMYCC